MTDQPLRQCTPLFKSLDEAEPVVIRFNGEPLTVPGGRSLAAALLASGVLLFRSAPVSGAPRAPFCMMGACFECLVEIDGVASRQSCMVSVRADMQVHTQDGARALPGTWEGSAHSSEIGHAR